MVFYDHPLIAAPKVLPRYLDLGYYAEQDGIPFTHSSNLVYALQAALKRTDWPAKFAQIREVSGWLRTRLNGLGLQVLAPEGCASPAVFTVALPVGSVSSKTIGWQLRKTGYLLSYQSGYLLKRNWIQICLMGEWSRENLTTLPDVLCHLCAQHSRTVEAPALAEVGG